MVIYQYQQEMIQLLISLLRFFAGESFAELHHGAAGQGAHATWQYICGLYFLLLLRWISSNTVYTFR